MTRDLARLLDRKLFEARLALAFERLWSRSFALVMTVGCVALALLTGVLGALPWWARLLPCCCRRGRRGVVAEADLAAALARQKRGLAASRSAFRASPPPAHRLEGSPRGAPALGCERNPVAGAPGPHGALDPCPQGRLAALGLDGARSLRAAQRARPRAHRRARPQRRQLARRDRPQPEPAPRRRDFGPPRCLDHASELHRQAAPCCLPAPTLRPGWPAAARSSSPNDPCSSPGSMARAGRSCGWQSRSKTARPATPSPSPSFRRGRKAGCMKARPRSTAR